MKTFIIGTDNTKKSVYDISNRLVGLNNDLDICRSFAVSKSENEEEEIGQYAYFLEEEEVIIAHKNDALIYLSFYDKAVEGITIDEFMNSDIIPIKHEHFNDIADPFLEDKVLLVLIDSKNNSDTKKKDQVEFNLIYERSDSMNLPLLYFYDDEEDIVDIVYEFMIGDDETREKILDENK